MKKNLFCLLFLLAGIASYGQTSYCDTDITHFSIAAETASAIKLTIVNTGANSMKVTIESTTADPVDDLNLFAFGGDITGAPTISLLDNSVAGKLSRTLTWGGSPPTNVDLNLTWSKMTTAANWQLKDGINETVAFNESCSAATPSLSGTTWKLAPMAGALKVGPTKGSADWWQNTAGDVTTRACLFDDTFVFNADGSFNNVQGSETWLETWQGVAEGCGAPISPHNGSNAATWAYDAGAGTVTLTGVGAHLGLAKVTNGSELGSPGAAPASVTYEVSFSGDGNTMTIDISIGSGYWQFILQKCVVSPLEGTWKLAPMAGALKVGPTKGSADWWQNTAGDVTTRACLFDDTFIFNADGSFNNVQGTETWLESWQGTNPEACGAPVSPHNGSNAATWAYDGGAGTVTLTGVGAHLGLAKVVNGSELASPAAAPASITYEVSLSGDGNTMTIDINFGAGYWQFVLQKCVVSPLEGTWKLAPMAGALKVGPTKGSAEWWQNTAGDVTTRACLFDDTFVFNSDGSFNNVQGTETWLESWQGTNPEACGTPVAPHNGSNAATWAYDGGAGTVTLTGVGAHLGLAKVVNGSELGSPGAAPASITYEVSLSGDGNTMTIDINFGAGYWQFVLQKCVVSPVEGTWKLAPMAGALAVGPTKGSSEWWSNTEADVTTRACLFDDTFVFNSDGSFNNVQGTETWLETWQGVSEGCGTPVAPHNGSNAATWAYDGGAGTLTLTGIGAHLGLAKVVNGSELASPAAAPASITYEVMLSGDGNTMTIDINIGAGYWRFILQKCGDEPTTAPTRPAFCDNPISIFSDVFTDQAGTNLDPDWDSGAGTVASTETIAGNTVLKYTNFTFQGIQLAGATDVSAMTHLHVDVWTPDATTINIYAINSGSPAVEKAYTLSLTKRQWNSFDIPLTAFSDVVDLTKIDQFKFDDEDGQVYFIDNLYFYGDCNTIPECPNLVWYDEFDGTTLDNTKWEAQIGDGTSEGIPGWGNSELQYYRAENAEVAGGKLTITARQESFGGLNYTSARLRTKGKMGGDITYGRFEASIKLPKGQGFWPAFWLLHSDGVYGPWPASGEIDIMELVGNKPDEIFATIHYGSSFATRQSTGSTYKLLENLFNDAFHKFAVEWDENVIRWYVDDYLFLTKTAADIAPEFWPFNQNFHMLLNLAVGGTFPGSPDGTSVFPQKMEVDYVRVYKGQFPYLTGKREVTNAATGEVYSVGNAKAGSTFNWTVPVGATIVSGQGTNSITVDFSSMAGIGTISATEGNGCTTNTIQMKVKVEEEKVNIIECSLENVDEEALITLGSAVGTLEDNVTNPASNAVNSSALSIKYTRNAGDNFDNIKYTTSAIMDASKFTSSNKKFYMDVYTDAPVGTTIRIQLENATKAAKDFPEGRHSYYDAVTTKQNEWEQLIFNPNSGIQSDGTVGSADIDQIVMLFDPGNASSNVYYFDNFAAYCTSTVGECATATPCITSSTCNITNLAASACPNGSSGTQLITIVDADNPNCFASIEAPICSDGSRVDITFTATESGPTASLTTAVGVIGNFLLLVNGQQIAQGGTSLGSNNFAFGGVVTPPSGTAGGVSATGSGGTPMASVSDPCSCNDSGNIKNADGSIRLFRDELTFTGVGAVVCTGNCGVFLDANGNPITNFGNSPGTVEFYRLPGDYSASTFTIGGVAATLDGGMCVDACTPIPTMSEWGLIIFGLLMLNLGLMFIYRKDAILNL